MSLTLMWITLSDKGFFELQKHREESILTHHLPKPPPLTVYHPNFCSRAAVMFKAG